ncbi:hypothetical protein SMSP2_01079 [Limihaloglobus sulfuriphilus]|uniref:DUF3108 domain-containing protein n=1 Tax=Limihaloglobus sulfuriphilus TaxID=1851148 RepID=A0A1Q2MDJ7_9BACT|nr:hypothetical protein [Limihaloglobus sulfuriphilus]AQQ70719.1 hypothetical protein SMSP2_01079 [Limihaloglobus sulfuriphilus]
MSEQLPFPLNTCEPALKELILPRQPFNSAGGWENIYDVWTSPLPAILYKVGTLKIRRVNDGEKIRIDLNYEKFLEDSKGDSGYMQYVTAEMLCENDKLATPLEWVFESKILTPDKKPVDKCRIKKKGTVSKDNLETRSAGIKQTVKFSGPCACSWALFDAVQRLSPDSFQTADFTLFDHFDQVKPEQKLSFRETAEVSFENGQNAVLNIYDQIGRGVVPLSYFVLKDGPLIALVSGLELYIRKEASNV